MRTLLRHVHKSWTTAFAPAEEARLPGIDVFGDGLPFGRLLASVAESRAVVSGDTGIPHLAVAHAAPSVTLLGRVPPGRGGPPVRPRHLVLWHPGPDGDPQGRRPAPVLLRIRPGDVLDAPGRLLDPS
ncbi:glycosyltransferase family 9 protein [Streptomyces sp. NPDC059861]|uniref:glycosyltransferase family 9 protein n=1 Tax=Streptomyces sp. NPDC059861 TaxID=3346974 RepID=UPI003661BC9D